LAAVNNPRLDGDDAAVVVDLKPARAHSTDQDVVVCCVERPVLDSVLRQFAYRKYARLFASYRHAWAAPPPTAVPS